MKPINNPRVPPEFTPAPVCLASECRNTRCRMFFWPNELLPRPPVQRPDTNKSPNIGSNNLAGFKTKGLALKAQRAKVRPPWPSNSKAQRTRLVLCCLLLRTRPCAETLARCYSNHVNDNLRFLHCYTLLTTIPLSVCGAHPHQNIPKNSSKQYYLGPNHLALGWYFIFNIYIYII